MNQKLENILNLALETDEAEREKSMQLNVGYFREEKTWELIVKYSGDIGRFASELIRIEELLAGYAIVTLPESLIDAFSRLEEVEYIEKPKRLYFSTLRGRQVSCIFSVTESEPFLTGEDVLIGIIDSGISVDLPEFLGEDGRTRIQYLWDQTLIPQQVDAMAGEALGDIGPSLPPEGFQTGVEFTKARIDRGILNNNIAQTVPSFDTSGHGTAVAAIAAAGGSLFEGRYKGVAPKSELIIVKMGTPRADSFPRTTELMRALTYVVKKAVELQKPIAVNLSFGNTYGSHDGTSLVERFLDNIAEVGRCVICVGSGNEGAAGGHVEGRGSGRIELNVGNYQQAFAVQLWKEYVDRFRLTLISPSGQRQEIDTLQSGRQKITMDDVDVLLYIGEPAPYTVNQEIYFDMLPTGRYVSSGIWTFEIEEISTVLGNYDFYLPSNTVLSADTRFFTPVPAKTLTIPSTASKIITVGAYDAVYDAYADFSGRGYVMQRIDEERSGPGNIKPDIVAPGVNITTVDPDGRPVQVSGTSFATPFVTGSAALLMEWGITKGNDAFLYGEKVKAYLRRGAREIRGESVYPNARVGAYGIIVSS